MSTQYVDVALIAVTEAESKLLSKAARTLRDLAEITGRQEHRDQSHIASKFSAQKFGVWESTHQVAVPVESE